MRQTVQQRADAETKLAERMRESERINRESEAAVLAAIDKDHPGFAFTSIHAHSLYGSRASIQVGDESPRYGESDSRCTWSEVGAMLAQFPPVPIILYRDGCVGVRPTDADDGKEGAEITDLWPVTIKIENGGIYPPQATVEWYTDLAPGLRVSFDVLLADAHHPARMVIESRRDKRTGAETERKCTGFRPADWFSQASADSMRIKYAGGSVKDPGSYLIYWPEGATQPGTVAETWLGMFQP